MKLNKKEGIAIFIGIAVLAYLLFSGPIMSLFNAGTTDTQMIIETGFKADDVTVGTGDLAERGDVVSTHYVGKLVNGQVFDSSLDRGVPIQFVLGTGQVIKGWDEGLVGMRVGGKRILTIAPDYGYGAAAVGTIPANSVLVFEVELVGIQKAPK